MTERVILSGISQQVKTYILNKAWLTDSLAAN